MARRTVDSTSRGTPLPQRGEVHGDGPQQQKVARERRVSHPHDKRRTDDGERGRGGTGPDGSDPDRLHDARRHRALADVGEEDPPPEGVDDRSREAVDDLRRQRRQRQRVVEEDAPAFGIAHQRQAEQGQAPRVQDVVVPGDEVGVVVVLGPDPLAAGAGDELRVERLEADEEADDAAGDEPDKPSGPARLCRDRAADVGRGGHRLRFYNQTHMVSSVSDTTLPAPDVVHPSAGSVTSTTVARPQRPDTGHRRRPEPRHPSAAADVAAGSARGHVRDPGARRTLPTT